MESSPKQYWESRLRTIGGLHAVGYLGLGPHYNRWLYRIQTTVFMREVARLLTDWSLVDVLDIGSGTGHYVKLWKTIGVRSVTGADFADAALENLRREFTDVAFCDFDIGGDMPDTLNRQFDVVSAFAVLYHIVDDARYIKAIANISKLVRPGGLFVFSENFLHRAKVRTDSFVSRTLPQIAEILRANDLEILKRVPMFVVMNAPLDNSSALASALWKTAMWPVRGFSPAGAVVGALLYPFDVVLTRALREGPSTELMVCKRLP